MTKKALSWQEKFSRACKDTPKVVEIKGKMTTRWGRGTVVIPSPQEIEDIMEKIPRGKLLTINEIRQYLAQKHKASIGCPITTGIFSWVVSWRAKEREEAGYKEVAPYWRVLKTGGEINPKYPGGTEEQRRLLEKEGHQVIRKGKRYLVIDYQDKLFTL
jgi:alkylated DNA nucleotide flippase Atl1